MSKVGRVRNGEGDAGRAVVLGVLGVVVVVLGSLPRNALRFASSPLLEGLNGGRGAPFGVVVMSGLACILLLPRGLVSAGCRFVVGGLCLRSAPVKLGGGIGGCGPVVFVSLSERACLALARASIWAGVRAIVTAAISPLDM